MFRSTALLAAVLVAGLADAQDATELRARLFSQNPGDISPEQTLEMLRQLDQLSTSATPNANEVRQLVKLSQVGADRCSCAQMMDYDDLRYQFTRMPSIGAYLESNARKQFDLCQQIYVGQLNKTVATLDPQDVQALSELTDAVNATVVADQNQFLANPNRVIAIGTLEYLEKFDQQYEDVRGLCQRVLPTLRTQMRGHFNLQCSEKANWETDPIRAQWMQSGWICSAIVEVEPTVKYWIQYESFVRKNLDKMIDS